ncbi:TIGR03936 family radical SAM-associated protein [uncultured Acidaminococcus sp.]|uniref:TIGR03936 family radical SAM-associated protein n=1 Tax=uncultured Acidaminococcus sp. TaxID=352152 RepID=UPI00262FE7BC|nr:TIGR03936 family radical SAM-associated protein [uncultured Acidaminococcus sp.]
MKLRLQITKEPGIRFISHLEYQRSIEKAIRRAGIPVAYSEGFNPHMKFSLASALSVGVTSTCEFAEIRLAEERPLPELVNALSAALPMGIHIVRADLAEDKAPKLMAQAQGAAYEVHVPCASDPASQLAAFAAAPEVLYTKAHKKGKGKPKTIDVKYFIPQVEARWQEGSLDLSFEIRITPTGSMKASEFLQVLEQDFQVSLAFAQADIRRVDLYSRDREGRKIPLIGKA